MIHLSLKDKKLEADPEARNYLDALNKKINEPEVLNVISDLTARYMAYGSITDKEIKEELEKVL